jgi:multidrug efflux pump subunit AcrA (membrane-fusion protein)
MRRVLLVLIGLVVVVLLAVGYYFFQVYAMPDGPAPAATASISQAPPTPGNVTADGTIAPRRHATLAFKIGGAVAEVAVKQGDVVQAGVALVRLDDKDLQNQVKQADAALNVAKTQLAQLTTGASAAERQAAQDALAAAQAKYDDAKKAGASSSALKEAAAGVSQAKSAVARLDPSPQALAVAQAQADQAQAADDIANAALDQASLKSPFGGTVAQVNVNVGDFIGPGMPVVVFGDLSRLRVESDDVSDLDVARVRLGQSVNVTLDALPGKLFHGTVASISPLASESRGYKVFGVSVDLKEGIENGLRWGMDAKIEIAAAGGAGDAQQ